MNTTEAHASHNPSDESMTKRVSGGIMGETIAAIAVIALAIVGLAGVFSETLAAIATIVLGAGILVEGGFFASAQGVEDRRLGDPGAFFSAGFLGGIAAVVLGILALLGIYSATLLAIAVLVLGAAFLLSSGAAFDFGGHALGGLAAVVLGILAIVGVSRPALVLVALLVLGSMALFSGAAMGARAAATRRSSI
jgi:hypothetical protein